MTPAAKRSRRSAPIATPAPPNDAIAHVRELAWTGQHERAVAECNDRLASAKASDVRLALLDLRAESHIALGRLADAAADAAAMVELARTMRTPSACRNPPRCRYSRSRTTSASVNLTLPCPVMCRNG